MFSSCVLQKIVLKKGKNIIGFFMPKFGLSVIFIISVFMPQWQAEVCWFFLMLKAGNFGADTFHSIRHRGFRVLPTSHWQSVSVADVSAFPFNYSSKSRPSWSAHRGAPHQKRGKGKMKKENNKKRTIRQFVNLRSFSAVTALCSLVNVHIFRSWISR